MRNILSRNIPEVFDDKIGTVLHGIKLGPGIIASNSVLLNTTVWYVVCVCFPHPTQQLGFQKKNYLLNPLLLHRISTTSDQITLHSILPYSFLTSSFQVKVDAKVQVPEALDLTSFRGRGLQSGEVLIPDNDGMLVKRHFVK